MSMESINLGPPSFGTPVSFEPYPGAPYAILSPWGTLNAHLARPGELGTQHFNLLGQAPETPNLGPSDAQKASVYPQPAAQPLRYARRPESTKLPADLVPAGRFPPELSAPPPRPRHDVTDHYRACDCHKCGDVCICPDCLKARAARRMKHVAARAEARKAERRKAAAEHETFFWNSVLGLLGATAWCLPCWWLVANDSSPGPFVGFLGGLWFMSTWLIAPASVIYFLCGVASVAGPRVE